MSLENQIVNIIEDKLKNPIYQTLQLLGMKSILKASNFVKKEGVEVYLAILHFVYMLVMNKKLSTEPLSNSTPTNQTKPHLS